MNHGNGNGPGCGNSGSGPQGPATIILPGTRLNETHWWWLI